MFTQFIIKPLFIQYFPFLFWGLVIILSGWSILEALSGGYDHDTLYTVQNSYFYKVQRHVRENDYFYVFEFEDKGGKKYRGTAYFDIKGYYYNYDTIWHVRVESKFDDPIEYGGRSGWLGKRAKKLYEYSRFCYNRKNPELNGNSQRTIE